MAQLRKLHTSILSFAPGRAPVLVDRVDPDKARAALLDSGVRPSYVNAITAGYAVLSDPYPARAWKLREE